MNTSKLLSYIIFLSCVLTNIDVSLMNISPAMGMCDQQLPEYHLLVTHNMLGYFWSSPKHKRSLEPFLKLTKVENGQK